MMKPIIFWGATGQAKVLHEFISSQGYELVALFDNDPKLESPLSDVPLHCGQEGFEQWHADNHEPLWCAVAIGGSRGKTRLDMQRWLSKCGLYPATLIHPTAFVASSASIVCPLSRVVGWAYFVNAVLN